MEYSPFQIYVYIWTMGRCCWAQLIVKYRKHGSSKWVLSAYNQALQRLTKGLSTDTNEHNPNL
jgi:hypothetical protein